MPRARRFTTPEGLASLERVLKAYAAFDPEVNYCQVRAARPCRRPAPPYLAVWYAQEAGCACA